MIKRLRAKFIAIIMVIVTLMLLVVFGFVLHNVRLTMERESVEVLRQYSREQRPGQLPGEESGSLLPVFSLHRLPGGSLEATGSTEINLADEQLLRAIYAAAMKDGKKTGILLQWDLRYYREDSHGAAKYVFLDISVQRQMLYSLTINCLLLFAAAVSIFFVITLLLSKWVVSPVEDAWNRQRQFVADASHELKTPLTVILTNAELLQSEDYDDAAKKRFSGNILSMSRQMRGLVEGLLDLARIDARKTREQMEEVNLSDLTEACVLGFEPVYFEAGRELCSTVEPGIRIAGSESHLRQVIDILLDNGCKYGTPGKAVVLTLKSRGRGKCLLQVTSQGPCLTKQQCKDIFKRFYRVDAARTMNRSYGLGLPIAQNIVQAHRGKIWAVGAEQGNSFCVLFPTI